MRGICMLTRFPQPESVCCQIPKDTNGPTQFIHLSLPPHIHIHILILNFSFTQFTILEPFYNHYHLHTS